MESLVSQYLDNFYQNKRVFITGCTGFKGSWLCAVLIQLGAKVTGYSLEPEVNNFSLFNLLSLNEKINYICADIKDATVLQSALKTQDFDIVFHLAAQPLVRLSYAQPGDTFNVNVMGTVNLLEAVRNSHSIKAIVNITTDKCYSNQESIWPYRESDGLGGYDPYSASKACSEIITSAYRQSFYRDRNIGLASARAGNVIGGGDFSKDRIIPDIVRSILNTTDISIRNPLAIRPWQHVLDVLNGYLILGKKLYVDEINYSEAFNFAPVDRRDVTVQELSDQFLEVIGINKTIINTATSNLHETKVLKLDPSKAITNLGWWPKFDANITINKTASWYKELLAKSDMNAITQEQITEYLNLN